MANLNAVDIKKGNVGANRNNNNRKVSGLVVSSPSLPLLPYKKTVELYGLFDAAQYGITEAFDRDNNVNVYRHIREFYRMAGEGVKLNLMVVSQDELLETIFEDSNSDMIKRLLVDSDGEIRQVAVAVNPETIGVQVDGLPSDVFASIPLAQGVAQWAYDQHMPCQILVEGYGLNGLSSVVPDLGNIIDLEAKKVSLVIGQDWQYAETKDGVAQKFADVGTILGVLAAAAINQNIGDNEAFDLKDATKNAWMVPGLSNHKTNKEIFAQLQTFENKRYIFGLAYAGLAGVRINNDHVCAPVVIDSEGNMNEHTIAYGRVMDDAARQLRSVYLPKIKKTYPVDAAGKLPTGVRVHLESIGDDVFTDMKNASEISSGKTTVDPESDLMVAKELKVSFNLQPTGVLGYLNGTINLKARQ